MSKLTVHRKSYKRKAYTRKGGTRVKATRVPASTFKIKDRGARGRGKKVIPPLKKGIFPKKFFSRSTMSRREYETRMASRVGEKKTVGRLRAIQVYNKRVNPKLSQKARDDSEYIAGSYRGKKRVPYPQGFSKNYRRKLKSVY